MKQAEEGRIEIFYHRVHDLLCFILCLLLIAAGLLSFFWGGGLAAPFGIQLMLPGIIGVSVLAKRVVKPTPVIVLDAKGISDFSKKTPWFIRWEDVEGVRFKKGASGYVVVIQPNAQKAYATSGSYDSPPPLENTKLARQLPSTERNYRELHALLNAKLTEHRANQEPGEGETKFVEYPRF